MRDGESKIHERIEQISKEKDIHISYKPVRSCVFTQNDMYSIVLDSQKTSKEQWVEFIKAMSCLRLK
ncbi:hypothetical protein HOO54_02655 [Bacillus sp. WMMC1349]|uniref:hypothetical protein n=1 Tax=Bacillus sp. WMMC1349 TaxID=2736254 RepID=UPI00155787D2|nr:hypothetical protein [Bacillus sp. WMMC1349]NPC91180.1 hypothetical protein [Bacillus sp. WMMC1349]